MGLPHFEVATGPIDGSNKTFFVSLPYAAGFTAVWLNGQLKRPDFGDGWTETSPATGRLDLQQAPLVGDVVQVFFVDASSTPEVQEVCQILGTIDDADELVGAFTASCEGELYGTIEACAD